MKLTALQKPTLVVLLAVTPAGFFFKFYSGPGHGWFNDHGAGLLYEIFWVLMVFLVIPRKRGTVTIPLGVFMVTCALEVLQLWHPPFLEKVRSSFLGKALIGTTFSWWDFPHYALGSLLGWICLRRIVRTSKTA